MIRLIRLLAGMAVLSTFVAHALASEPMVIGWDALAPAPVEYDNPFQGLTAEQLDGLRTLLAFQSAEDNEDGTGMPAEAAALRAELEADGLDVDWLFEQRRTIMETRRKNATATNEELLGQSVRIAGYLLPLEMEDQKATEFLLVPTLGACIHTPPPPANQLVHVRYPVGFVVDALYTPVWISGELLAERKMENVRYSDGERRVDLSYTMTAQTVEAY